eukprot:GHVL01040304.1.p1 GENE.GHVL01040304.1~~GHVL01040304.1.p1  ORF type:complete len:525 (+),score=123.70 GHVL01040304.1:3481-5055(+)
MNVEESVSAAKLLIRQRLSASSLKSYNAKSFDAKSYDTKSFDTKSYDAKSFDAESYDAKSFDAKPYDAKSFDAKSCDIRASESVTSHESISSDGQESKSSRFREASRSRELAAVNRGDKVIELRSRLGALEIDIEDKKKTIQLYKTTLSDERNSIRENQQTLLQRAEDKFKKEKIHYEETMERQLKMLNRLLEDKSELTKKCESLQVASEKFVAKSQEEMEKLEKDLMKDFERKKQSWNLNEKLRRETWEKEKTQEIKEVTIKGLEPEIERIMADHKREIRNIEDRQMSKLAHEEDRLNRVHSERMKELRSELSLAHDEELENERYSHRKKLANQFEEFESQLSNERNKLANHMQVEFQKFQKNTENMQTDHKKEILEAVNRQRLTDENEIHALTESLAAQERRHAAIVSEKETQYEEEAKHWKTQVNQRLRIEFEAKQSEFEKACEEEQNKQLEELAERLSRDQVETVERMQAENDKKILEQEYNRYIYIYLYIYKYIFSRERSFDKSLKGRMKSWMRQPKKS